MQKFVIHILTSQKNYGIIVLIKGSNWRITIRLPGRQYVRSAPALQLSDIYVYIKQNVMRLLLYRTLVQ